MAVYTYTVKKGSFTGTVIDNVTGVSWMGGRTLITDQLASGQYRITGRRPDLLPTMAIGDILTVYYTFPTTDTKAITLAIADFKINYGLTSSADTWEVIGEDAFAALGRTQVTFNVANTVGASITALATASGVGMSSTFGGREVFDQTVTGVSGLTAASILFATEQPNSLRPTGSSVLWSINGPTPTYFTYTATDATPTAGQWKYDALDFGGLADNYATKVNVISTGVGTGTSGTGKRLYELNSYNKTLTDANNLAGVFAGYLSQTTNVPATISFLAESQQTGVDIISPIQWSLNNAVLLNVVFRGTTYYTMILGVSVTATPESTRVTYRLAPSQLLTAFTLNSTTLGVLDQNRLGF